MAKKVLVSCGTGIATSTVVAKKIESVLNENGINAVVEQCKASEVPSKAERADLIVTTTPISGAGNTPIVQSIAFLTGIGMENDLKKIIDYLK
jgi:galactitol PTS system EIIB component